jgi:hypothetical protein
MGKSGERPVSYILFILFILFILSDLPLFAPQTTGSAEFGQDEQD